MARLKTGWLNQISIEIKRRKHWIGVGASIVLGLIFAAAAVAKLLHQPEAFRIFFSPFPGFLSPAFTKAFLIWLPRLELVVGLLLILGIAAKLVATLSLVLIAGFITNNGLLLIQGRRYCPSCFGPQVTLRALDALYIDIVMLALVLIILFCYRGHFFNIYPWFLKRGRIAEKKDWPGSG